jgi:hypothetical protein
MTPICKTQNRVPFGTCVHVSLYTKYIYNLMYYISIYILGSEHILLGHVFLTQVKRVVGVTTKNMCPQHVSTLHVSTNTYVSTLIKDFL